MCIRDRSTTERIPDEQEVSEIYHIMRDAYARTESAIWGENYTRMPLQEYRQLVEKGLIHVARIENEVVGCIYCYKVSDEVMSFSLLGTKDGNEGRGIGGALIDHVEAYGRDQGCSFMYIEILRPKNFELEVKSNLRRWYEKKGYVFSHHQDFAERRPDRAPFLITPSHFECFRKEL